MPGAWVDFKEVRSKVRFSEVLDRYAVQLRVKGDQLVGFCPLPSHQGKRTSPSFSVNLKKNIFQCFGCGAKGNVIDFAAFMEGLDPNDTAGLRQAALLLQERFLDGDNSPEPPPAPVRRMHESRSAPPETERVEEEPEPEPSEDGKEVVVNAPLDFTLTTLDPNHPYLKDRGLTVETVATFGLGFCSRGLMKGRIAIPLHDMQGQLIGYAGRLVEDTAVGPDSPKYLLPGTRERDGVVYRFSKSLFLFNAFRLLQPVRDLVIVEGFFGAMWLHQHGYPVVALMGSTCSELQAEEIVALVHHEGRVWVMPDGDEAGRRMAHGVFEQIGPYRLVRWLELRDGRQPEDCSAEDLAEWFGW